MDIVSAILNVVDRLWNCTAGQAAYITDLTETISSLRMKMEELKSISNDVELKVLLAEQQGMTRSSQVDGWLTRVEDTENKVNEILREEETRNQQFTGKRLAILRRFRFWAAYKFGKRARKLLKIVEELLSKGEFQEVANQQLLSRITELSETLTSLSHKREELKAISDDVKLKVQLAEQQGMVRTNQVDSWLTMVEDAEKKVNGILLETRVQDEQMVRSSSRILRESRFQDAYKLKTKASKTLDSIIELIGKGEFGVVAHHQPTEKEGFSEFPMENTVGIESISQSVLEHLRDEKVGIIGLYGMGGVGKTTLLKRIYNELPRTGDDAFDVAIWVVASKQATVESMQRNILEKLHIPFDSWGDKSLYVRSALIYRTLKVKKCILMLDDVWERLDLSEVGVPTTNHQKKSKVIFTTRSEEICGLMEAHLKIKITCLSWEKAWDLFRDKVGEAVLSSHYKIPKLAELVAKECDGLPLALITIGRAMSCRKTPYEWSHALKVLQKYPSKFSGMGEHVLPVLKFSYDNLSDQTIKNCFVYCCIFPEDYEIPNNKLVDLWIGEGFLKEFNDIIEARNQGLYIIESLKLACLLESGSISHLHVKMHDVLRDMALWIASDYGACNGKFLVSDKADLLGVQSNTQLWYDSVEKMMLLGNMVKNPILNCLCPQLSTLVVNGTKLQKIQDGLFQFIPFLRVLDLSGNKMLKLLPIAISTLTLLEYLDLSRTALEILPAELKGLSRLRHLLLNYMEKLKECPSEIISCLTNLWVFRMNNTSCVTIEFLTTLNQLQKINETSICLHKTIMLIEFLESKRLQRTVRYLRLNDLEKVEVELSPTNMENLEALQIICSNLTTLKISSPAIDFCNLQHIIISSCDFLNDLDCLVYAPFLENLWVKKCKSLQRIVRVNGKDDVTCAFSNLKRMRLDDLPKLMHICDDSLPFPSLEKVYVNKCPVLGNPFDNVPVKSKLKFIMGDLKWWNSLNWKHAELKQHLSHHFRNWTASKVVETVDGPNRLISGEWPEFFSANYTRDKEGERLHVLRSSMNLWEE